MVVRKVDINLSALKDAEASVEEIVSQLRDYKLKLLEDIEERIRMTPPIPSKRLTACDYEPWLDGYRQALDNMFYILKEEAK